MEALVTEPSFLSSLGIVRSLAKKGILVHVLGDSNHRGLDVSFHSRYCTERIIGPSPRKTEFVDFLVQVLEDRNIDVLIPAAYWSAEKIVKNRTKLDPLTHVEMVNAESFTVAASKKKTYELAKDLGVPFPKTVYPQSYDEVEDISTNIRYPAVIKPLDEGYSHPSYPKNPEELLKTYREMCEKFSFSKGSFPLIQEYVAADITHSFSALYQHGVCRRVFMWDELRSDPPTGGSGAFSISTYNPAVKAYGLKLLDGLNWHGVANIEFRLDERDKQLKLMEINPRFWASVELAVKSGVDYPHLLCRMSNGEQLKYSEEYRRNVKFHWFSRELEHLLQRPSSIPRIVADSFDPETKTNIQLTDFGPHVFEFALMLTTHAFSSAKYLKDRLLRHV